MTKQETTSKKSRSRKSISIRGETYTKISKYCAKKQITISSFVESLIQEFFDAKNIIEKKEVKQPEAKQPEVKEKKAEGKENKNEIKTKEKIITTPVEKQQEFSTPFHCTHLKKEPPPKIEDMTRTGGVFMF